MGRREIRVCGGVLVELGKKKELGKEMITDRNPDLGFTASFDSIHETKPKQKFS